MKKQIIYYKLLLLFCSLRGWTFSFVAGQYYYFDTWTTGPFQQWCNENLAIKINTEGQQARAGRFHLILDTWHFLYSTSDVADILRVNIFSASTNTFTDRSSSASPSWKLWSNHTILQIDRKNDLTNYHGNNSLYGTIVGLIPFFNATPYTGFVAMEYDPWISTTETTLSAPWWYEIINSWHQIPRMTGYFYVQQAPCINDLIPPTFIVSTPTVGTKKSHLSGILLTLNENGGGAGIGVPYVRTGGSLWTDNVWGITNQYGISLSTFKIRISGDGTGRYFTGGMFSPAETLSAVPNGKTWQFLDKNFSVHISGSQLFDYGIERPITITWTVQDRINNTTNFWPLIFNTPVSPWLITWSDSPTIIWATWIDAMAPIRLWIADDRAWVNSWTISITLSGVWGTMYGPYIFSGSDLNLSWVQWVTNQPDWYITISDHIAFPNSWTILVHVYARDMAGTLGNIQDYTFRTRPSCTEIECCNQIYIQTGNDIPFFYTGTNITVSGGINPSFIINGNTGIINCGVGNQGMNLYRWTEEYSWSATYLNFLRSSQLIFSGANVKATLSGKTIYLQYLYVPPITWWCIGNACPCINNCWRGGGTLAIDDCQLPSTLACANAEWLDNSDSYYDDTCCTATIGHGVAGCDVSDSPYDQEITNAFQRGYDLNITNKCPIIDARLDDTIIRKDLAKMITMFTIQIIGIYPDTHKAWCDTFTDTSGISEEMQFFTKTACQLSLMGLEPDGNTPKKTFEPNDLVNRAQFGTILSRLIYGDTYNIHTGEEMALKRYERHLSALQQDAIMTQIQDPFMLEKRARVLIMLNRTTLDNLVEKYHLVAPAHNWALSLLENIW